MIYLLLLPRCNGDQVNTVQKPRKAPMSYFEDITRIRVNEAIRDGLKSQEDARGLERRNPVNWKTTLVVIGLAVLLVIFL
jgi:hypothetical protein